MEGSRMPVNHTDTGSREQQSHRARPQNTKKEHRFTEIRNSMGKIDMGPVFPSLHNHDFQIS